MTLLAAVAGLTFLTAPNAAGADPWEPPSSGGGSGGGGFDAWAFYAAASGGRGTATPETCDLPRDFWGDSPTSPPAHIEYVAYEIPPGSGHYSVWKDCVRDGHTVNPDLPGSGNWFPLDNWQAEAGDPDELIREALAHLHPDPPAIGTSPDAATASLVGMSTWFWLEGGLPAVTGAPISDGPLTVTVTATPVGVTWDPGDGGDVVCRDELHVGVAGTDTCSYTYGRSSSGQDGSDDAGRPAYTVSASIEYVGSYSVTLGGVPVGADDNIGGVERVSETALAVNEAQAINTRDR